MVIKRSKVPQILHKTQHSNPNHQTSSAFHCSSTNNSSSIIKHSNPSQRSPYNIASILIYITGVQQALTATSMN